VGIRGGLHTGEREEVGERDSIHGLAVRIAARVEGCCSGWR
jgi:hypothetical protein